MGSEDLFKKRKARKAEDLARQKQIRQREPRFLIVCEGTKTEPQYFGEILKCSRIAPQTVKIAPNNGTSPDQILAHALKLFDEDAVFGDGYDSVYCVFDRDSHTTFESTIREIAVLHGQKKPVTAITSTPCFEFWLLLHFGYTDAPFHAAGRKSVGDQVLAQLRTKPGFSKYAKGAQNIHQILEDKLSDAIKHAKRLRKAAGEMNQISANPWTNVDELVGVLRNLTR